MGVAGRVAGSAGGRSVLLVDREVEDAAAEDGREDGRRVLSLHGVGADLVHDLLLLLCAVVESGLLCLGLGAVLGLLLLGEHGGDCGECV